MTRAPTAAPQRDPRTKTWGFVIDSEHRGPDGRRRQIRRRGFPTKAAAAAELERVRADDRLVTQHVRGLSVADVLTQFVQAKEVAGRAPQPSPSTSGLASG